MEKKKYYFRKAAKFGGSESEKMVTYHEALSLYGKDEWHCSIIAEAADGSRSVVKSK